MCQHVSFYRGLRIFGSSIHVRAVVIAFPHEPAIAVFEAEKVMFSVRIVLRGEVRKLRDLWIEVPSALLLIADEVIE
jgi:hypothetical protein